MFFPTFILIVDLQREVSRVRRVHYEPPSGAARQKPHGIAHATRAAPRKPPLSTRKNPPSSKRDRILRSEAKNSHVLL